MSALIQGPRQCICRVVHPQRGEGDAVYQHGPSFFRPLDGAPIAMPVRSGGCSTTRGEWMVLDDPDHGRVEATLVTQGERHERMWSPLLGAGWLVSEIVPEAWRFRFEADDGRVVRFSVNQLAVGTPDYVQRSARKRSRWIEPTPEEASWRTYGLVDGSTMALRKEGPPPADAAAPEASAKQASLRGVR